MSRFSSLTKFNFEPVVQGVSLATVATPYKTPLVLREKLQSLALLGYTRGTAKFYMEHDSTEGEAIVRLTDGVFLAYEQVISLASSPVAFENEADITGFTGGSRMYWEIEVTTAGSANSTGRIIGNLSVETPLFVSPGQC